jgi:hypothetical protein
VSSQATAAPVQRLDPETYRADAIARATVECDRLRSIGDRTDRKFQRSLNKVLLDATEGMTVENDYDSAVFGLAFVGLGVFVVSVRRDYATGKITVTERWYAIGDQAAWGGHNITYYGTVDAVTAKRVSIKRRGEHTPKKSLDMSTFLFWNKLTMNEIHANNMEDSRSI